MEVKISITHDEIHIIRGLVMSLQYGDIGTDTELDFVQLAELGLKLERAHEAIIRLSPHE